MSVFGLLNFKEWVTWPWCESEFASHAKPIVTYDWILTPRPFKERLLTSCFQNLQKLNITLSNTDNFALQYFPFADFKFLNLIWDLKVGVPRHDWFQTSINNVGISHTYVHADEIVYSKRAISLKKPWALQLHCHINGWFPSTTCQAKTYLQTFQLYWY